MNLTDNPLSPINTDTSKVSWKFMCMLPYHLQMGMMGQIAISAMVHIGHGDVRQGPGIFDPVEALIYNLRAALPPVELSTGLSLNSPNNLRNYAAPGI